MDWTTTGARASRTSSKTCRYTGLYDISNRRLEVNVNQNAIRIAFLLMLFTIACSCRSYNISTYRTLAYNATESSTLDGLEDVMQSVFPKPVWRWYQRPGDDRISFSRAGTGHYSIIWYPQERKVEIRPYRKGDRMIDELLLNLGRELRQKGIEVDVYDTELPLSIFHM